MSKKRSIILISVITLIAVVFVIFSTVFRVKTQTVIFTSETDKFSIENIVQASEIKKGKTVFFINKEKVTAKIEKAVPYSKITKIETRFPNKILYYVDVRSEFAYFEKNSNYYILDNELKILKISDQKPNLIELEGIVCDCEAGDFVENSGLKTVFSMFGNKYQITKDGVAGLQFSLNKLEALTKIEKVSFDVTFNSYVFKIGGGENYSIKIVNDNKFENKVVSLIGIIKKDPSAPTISESERNSGNVFEIKSTSNGLVVS